MRAPVGLRVSPACDTAGCQSRGRGGGGKGTGELSGLGMGWAPVLGLGLGVGAAGSAGVGLEEGQGCITVQRRNFGIRQWHCDDAVTTANLVFHPRASPWGFLYPSRLVRGKECFGFLFVPVSRCRLPRLQRHNLLPVQHSEVSRPVSRSSRCRSRALLDETSSRTPVFGGGAAGVRGAGW